jgi:hypothetical protein
MDMRKRLTVADLVLMTLLAGATVASVAAVTFTATEGSTVLIQREGTTLFKLDLHEPKTVNVEGSVGMVTVEVRDGSVAVTHADCPNHICVRTGWRSHAGAIIVCAPNRVLVRIIGRQTGEIRGITG